MSVLSPNLLIIEHQEPAARDLQHVLRRVGYGQVRIARSADEGFRLIEQERPDLALVAVDLDGPRDGLRMGDRLTSEYGLPIVYVTPALPTRDGNGSMMIPSGSSLAPPFRADEVRATVALALNPEDCAPQLLVPLDPAQAFLTTDLFGRIAYLNTAAEALTGWRLIEVVDRPYKEIFSLVDGLGNPVNHRPFDPLASGLNAEPKRLRTRNGAIRLVREQTVSLLDRRGHPTGLAIVFQPVEREEFAASPGSAGIPVGPQFQPVVADVAAPSPGDEDAGNQEGDGCDVTLLKASLADSGATGQRAELDRLTAIVEGIDDPLFAMDRQWRLTFVNERAAEHFGRPRSELMGRVFWEEFKDSVHSKYYFEYYKALTRQQAREFEFHQGAKDRWLEAQAYPFSEGLIVFLRDVTERKRAQEQSSKLEKLESLGLLARGFAHDFNNLLTVLLGNLSLASVLPAGERQRHDALETARQATVQAQNLVQQLLTFAKGGAPIREAFDLNQIIRERFEHRTRSPHIQYSSGPESSPLWVEVDKGQIERLIENLLRNAEQAMPAGGTVTIKAGFFDRDRPGRLRVPNLDPNTRYVLMQVIDKGEGIPAKNLDKIFEPYFSTRTDANATGLGLTVCDSIAKGHQGFLTVNSRFGKHTQFNLFLPALHQLWQAGSKSASRQVRVKNEPPRVLILDDEESIRVLIGMALRQDGLEVVETSEGRETVEAYRAALAMGKPFDLVIMDLSIPQGMGGAEAIQQLLHVDPDVAAIVSSGYSDDPVMAQFKDYGFAAVLPKPYAPSDLRKLVAGLMKRAN